MRKSVKKFVAIMVTMMICSSFAFTVAHADVSDYACIGFGTSQYGDLKSIYTKGQTQHLDIFAVDGSGNSVPFVDDVVYASSNENVVTINAGGTMTARDYGVATVTATCGTLTARMLVTVTPAMYSTMDPAKENVTTSLARTGTKAASKYVDTSYPKENGHLIMRFETFHWPSDPKTSNIVVEGWFYDNGGTTANAESAIGFRRNNDFNNTGAIGVLHSTDTTYQISSVQSSDNILDTDMQGARVEDTLITRTKGWHQVTMIESYPGASGNVKGPAAKASNGDLTKSGRYEIYLDGKRVRTKETEHDTQWQVYGCAGMTAGTTAYFDDGAIAHYMQVNGVTLTTDPEDSDTLVANVDYVGYSGTSATKTYKWYYADSEDAASWTAIAGATQSSYTPANLPPASFVKAGVVVTDTIGSTSYSTEEYFSAPEFIFDGTFQHISLGKNAGSYAKTAGAQQLNLYGYDKAKEEHEIADLTGATFSSSNENVLTVTDAGVLTPRNLGIATVTATYQGKTATMLVTVTNYTYTGDDVMSGNGSDFTRTGANTKSFTGGTHAVGEKDFYVPYAKICWLVSQWGPANATYGTANAVTNVWFYDNGTTDDAIAAVYMSARNVDHYGTRAVGIFDSSDTTYKVTKVGARRPKTAANAWRANDNVGICDEVINGGFNDTGIARTTGWHQVSFVRKNTNDGATINDDGNKRCSSYYAIYLDGQFVHGDDSEDRSFMYLYGYAGWDESHTAYFADGSVVSYIGVEDVALTESNSTFTVNRTYYGKSGAQTNAYKWQVSDDGLTGWTDIAGATSGTYTPTVSTRNKYVRGLVSVTAGGVETGYENSAAARPNFSLISATPSATEVNVSLRIANDTEASIPYALLIGYYNAAETEIVAFDSQVSTVASGSSKTTHTFIIPEAIRGNFSKAKVFLWENVNQITPYTMDILAQ